MSVHIAITHDQIGLLARTLGRVTPSALSAGLRRAGPRCVSLLRTESQVRVRRPYRGQYHAGWDYLVIGGPSLTLFNTARHAVFVERGRRAGARMPPVAALRPWVEQVLGVPSDRSQGVAYAVARNISRRGIRARPTLLDPAVQARLVALVPPALRDELVAAVRRTVFGGGT